MVKSILLFGEVWKLARLVYARLVSQNHIFFIRTLIWMIHICFSIVSMRGTQWWSPLHVLKKNPKTNLASLGNRLSLFLLEIIG
jgi:hypothetical protein